MFHKYLFVCAITVVIYGIVKESLDAMSNKLEQPKVALKVSYIITVLGSSGVGKTTVLSKFYKDKCYHSTRIVKSRQATCEKTITKAIKLGFCELRFPLNFPANALPPKEILPKVSDIFCNPQIASTSSLTGSILVTTRNEGSIERNNKARNCIAEVETGDVINFLDNGGQPKFVNILPAVSCTSITYVVLNLSNSLDSLVHVQHNVNGESLFAPYYLWYTNLELIKHIMVSVENLNEKVIPLLKLYCIQKKDGENNFKTCFNCTHALNLGEEEILQIDGRLSSIASNLRLQQKRLSWFSSLEQQLFKRLFLIDLDEVLKKVSDFLHDLDEVLKKVSDCLHDLDEVLKEVSYCLQLSKEHFPKLNKLISPTEYIHCYTKLTEGHRVWLQVRIVLLNGYLCMHRYIYLVTILSYVNKCNILYCS